MGFRRLDDEQEPVVDTELPASSSAQAWVEPESLPAMAEPFARAEQEPVIVNESEDLPVIDELQAEDQVTPNAETDADLFKVHSEDLRLSDEKPHEESADDLLTEGQVVEVPQEQVSFSEPIMNDAPEPAVTLEESDVKGKVEEQEMPIFQSYHTIDYFASQGIKVSAQVQPQDKLGTQLRSFTEWLKTMKRLPPSKLEDELDDSHNSDVAALAAHSIEDKEIVTETMAEVLAKQGKTARALDIYHKLSLLNPSKSAYFADKIGELKNRTA